MRELTSNEVESVNGGIVMWAAVSAFLMAYQATEMVHDFAAGWNSVH